MGKVENGELGEDMTVLGSAGDVEGEVRVDIWRGIMNPPPAIFTAADTVMDTSLEVCPIAQLVDVKKVLTSVAGSLQRIHASLHPGSRCL